MKKYYKLRIDIKPLNNNEYPIVMDFGMVGVESAEELQQMIRKETAQYDNGNYSIDIHQKEFNLQEAIKDRELYIKRKIMESYAAAEHLITKLTYDEFKAVMMNPPISVYYCALCNWLDGSCDYDLSNGDIHVEQLLHEKEVKLKKRIVASYLKSDKAKDDTHIIKEDGLEVHFDYDLYYAALNEYPSFGKPSEHSEKKIYSVKQSLPGSKMGIGKSPYATDEVEAIYYYLLGENVTIEQLCERNFIISAKEDK